MLGRGGFMSDSSPNSASGNTPQPQPSTSPHSEDPLSTKFKNSNWPANMITEENVLIYFCDHSNPFYDKTSINEQFLMQNMDAKSMADIMLTTTGTQYQVVHASPPLFVISKIHRKSPHESYPISFYYVCNGSVYQCPDLNTVIQSRMCAAVDSLNKAFMLVLNKARFSTSKGYSWSTKKKEKEDGETKVEEDDEMMQQDDEVDEQQDQDGDLEDNDDEVGKPNDQFGTYYQKARTTRLLQVLFEKFPPPIDGNVELRPPEEGQVNTGQES